MAWFKQSEQQSPAASPIQAPMPPAATEHPAAAVAPPAIAPAHAPAHVPAPQMEVVRGAGASSHVSRGIVLRGEISGREDLSVDGEVEGTLRLSGARIIIGPAGRVRASVTAREIVVHGEVRGDLHAEERIEIGRSGSVLGNASAKRIAIEDGAVFNGSIEVLRPGEPAGASREHARPALRAAAGVAAAPVSAPISAPASAAASVPGAGQAGSASAPVPAGGNATKSAWRDEAVTAGDSLSVARKD